MSFQDSENLLYRSVDCFADPEMYFLQKFKKIILENALLIVTILCA